MAATSPSGSAVESKQSTFPPPSTFVAWAVLQHHLGANTDDAFLRGSKPGGALAPICTFHITAR